MDFERFDVTDEHAFLLLGPLACVIWRAEISVEATEMTEALAMRGLERSPDGVGLLFFPEATTPSLEVRRVSTTINVRLHEAGAVGVAGVFFSDELLRAVQRGIATGMEMLAERRYPLKAFGRIAPACEWLAELLAPRGVFFDTVAATALLEEARPAYLEHGAAWL